MSSATKSAAIPLVVAAALGVGLFAQAAFAQERIVKSEEGEPLTVDESGLTNLFQALKKMTRHTDTAELEDGAVEIHTGRLPTKGPDYAAFLELDSGLVEFQTTAAIKLRTEATLRFGEVELKPGNVSPGYAGLYSLWIEKEDSGDWRLIFNEEPDAWGTMHDPAKDVGAVALDHSITEGAESQLSVDLDAEAGLLRFAWGEHSWSTPFSAG